MVRGNGRAAVIGAEAAPGATGEVVLVVGLGRRLGGKSTGLAELVWRARNAGREVIVADGTPRSRTLAGLFPKAMQPPTEELPDLKAWLTGVLNRMVKARIPRMAGILLARSSEICCDFQQLAASSVAAPWNT